MTNIDQIRATVADVAALVGATVTTDPENTWQGRMVTADGIELIFSTWHKKTGEVWAYIPRPGSVRESAKGGEIGCNFSRGAVAVAKEIENRLLPVAREKAAAARQTWAELDNQTAQLQETAKRFDAMPGVRTTLESPGTINMRLKVWLYRPEAGCLSADITGAGSVHVDRVTLKSSGSQVDNLAALIALIGAA